MGSYKTLKSNLSEEDFERQLHESIKKIPWEMKKVKLYLSILKKINYIKNFFTFK